MLLLMVKAYHGLQHYSHLRLVVLMKIIDQYQTPDGKYEYRVEIGDKILPPMSFNDEKKIEDLESIAATLSETLNQEKTVETSNSVTITYEDETELTTIIKALDDAKISYTLPDKEEITATEEIVKKVV